jgi:hypothetical protein
MKYEYCCKCSEPTGKAGAGDDSLYTDHDGPFCEDCFSDKERPQRTWVGLTDDEIEMIVENRRAAHWEFVRQVEAKLKEKNNA